MSKYVCCQGYVVCPCNCCRMCFHPGSCGERSCPRLCLCVESCCFNGFAVSTNRLHIQQKYNLSSDPCDYRMMVFNNWLQLLSCVLDIFALVSNNNSIRDLAMILDWISDIVYFSISGCMTAQAAVELDYQQNLDVYAADSHPLLVDAKPVPEEEYIYDRKVNQKY